VRFLRPVELGETIRTTTTVLGLKDSASKGKQHRGKVWLGIRTVSDAGPIVEYERCALVRSRVPDRGGDDAIPGPGAQTPLHALRDALPDWYIGDLPAESWDVGETRVDPLRDHVDLAAPLARLTFNQAAIHRDETLGAGGLRLVYGGHVQGLAEASLTRMLPGLILILAWDGCDHLGPVREGELLEFSHNLVERAEIDRGGAMLRFEVVASAPAAGRTAVLRWTPIVWAPHRSNS
jgi:acyl dehydratase